MLSCHRVLLAMGWKQFDVIAEIASLNIPLTALRSIEKKPMPEMMRTYQANRKVRRRTVRSKYIEHETQKHREES